MFDIGASELLVIVVVAILVIGPKDMPAAMRAAGRWIGKARRMSNHFRAGIDEMVRQAEIEDMEEKWAARNKEIMAKYPDGDSAGAGAPAPAGAATDAAPAASADGGPSDGAPQNLLPDATQGDPPVMHDPDAAAEAAIRRAAPVKAPEHSADEPPLPLEPPAGQPREDGTR